MGRQNTARMQGGAQGGILGDQRQGIGIQHSGAPGLQRGVDQPDLARAAPQGRSKAQGGDPGIRKPAGQVCPICQAVQQDCVQSGSVFGQCRRGAGQRDKTGPRPQRRPRRKPGRPALPRTAPQDQRMAMAVFVPGLLCQLAGGRCGIDKLCIPAARPGIAPGAKADIGHHKPPRQNGPIAQHMAQPRTVEGHGQACRPVKIACFGADAAAVRAEAAEHIDGDQGTAAVLRHRQRAPDPGGNGPCKSGTEHGVDHQWGLAQMRPGQRRQWQDRAGPIRAGQPGIGRGAVPAGKHRNGAAGCGQKPGNHIAVAAVVAGTAKDHHRAGLAGPGAAHRRHNRLPGAHHQTLSSDISGGNRRSFDGADLGRCQQISHFLAPMFPNRPHSRRFACFGGWKWGFPPSVKTAPA